MSTDFPGSIDSYSTKVDNVDDVMAAHINDPQDAIVAIETLLGAGGGNLASANIFINGGFDVWQRTTDDTGVTTAVKYVADRWAVNTSGGTLGHVQRSTTVRTGAKTRYSLQLDGAGGVGTVDIRQRIEAALVGQYKQTLSFSAYVYNGSGSAFTPTLYVSTPSASDDWTTSTVRNGGGSGESLQECADSAWTKVYWSADVSGYTNIGNGLEFRIRIPSGYLVASDTVRLAEMQLLPGDENYSDFITRPLPIEITLCYRYLYKYENPPAAKAIGTAYTTSTTAATAYIPTPTPMRTAPTYTTDGTTSLVHNGSAVTATGVSNILLLGSGIKLRVDDTGAGFTANYSATMIDTGNIEFAAEL